MESMKPSSSAKKLGRIQHSTPTSHKATKTIKRMKMIPSKTKSSVTLRYQTPFRADIGHTGNSTTRKKPMTIRAMYTLLIAVRPVYSHV